MSTLKELLKENLQQAASNKQSEKEKLFSRLIWAQAQHNATRRKVVSYEKRVQGLEHLEVKTESDTRRPSRKRYHNGFSREEFGTIGLTTRTARFSNSHITCACKVKDYHKVLK